MQQPPKWYMPVAVAALLWNLLGCAAYLMDVTMSPETLATLTEAQQAMYAARPGWSVAATAAAVWFGAAGSLGLVLKKHWANAMLLISLAGCVVQDASMFMMGGAAIDPTALALQGMVLVIAVLLVLLGRKAAAQGWIA